jgi:hypothetical protein
MDRPDTTERPLRRQEPKKDRRHLGEIPKCRLDKTPVPTRTALMPNALWGRRFRLPTGHSRASSVAG